MGAYASSLPTLGGYSPSVYPGGGGPTYLSVNVGGAGLAPFMTGQYVTPQFVTDQSAAAQRSRYGATQAAANVMAPGLTVGDGA
jgi:hypothetical protein